MMWQLQVRHPAADSESVRLLVDAFNLYDKDNSGSICRDELRDVLRATGKNPTEGRENAWINQWLLSSTINQRLLHGEPHR